MSSPRTIAVIVRATDRERVSEALRAAVGLTLRGDRVEVLLGDEARALADRDPRIRRSARTLTEIGGHRVDSAGDDAIAALVRRADAVEVWT